jgi:hypothetical protein
LARVKIVKVTLNPVDFSYKDIPALRGFLSKKYPKYDQLHNHTKDGKFRYVYPEIQFKYVDGNPLLIAYGEAIKVLVKVFTEVGYMDLNHKRITIHEKGIQMVETELGQANDFIRYKFITSWMALNQNNYEEFKTLNPYDQEIKLNEILWGNLKTISHAFDYWIPDPNEIKVNGHFKMESGKFKGNTMLLFKGDFLTNFYIPEYLGLGKQVARGYGAIFKIKEKR